jgi:hypothetical protein
MANIAFELTDEVARKIYDLIQLDIDAVRAYAQAIDGVDEEHDDVAAQLAVFQADHQVHVAALSAALLAVGREPPDYKADFKGFLIEGMTAIRAKLGTLQALKAMRQNELLTNRRYQEAVELDGIPAEIMLIIETGRDDEARHLAYIERVIAEIEGKALPIPV